MSETKRVFVLVGDEQTPLSPQDVAGMVMGEGYKSAVARTGFSESTLRKFLAANGIKSRRPLLLEKQVDETRDPLIPLAMEDSIGG